jgi:hypothetical protein
MGLIRLLFVICYLILPPFQNDCPISNIFLSQNDCRVYMPSSKFEVQSQIFSCQIFLIKKSFITATFQGRFGEDCCFLFYKSYLQLLSQWLASLKLAKPRNMDNHFDAEGVILTFIIIISLLLLLHFHYHRNRQCHMAIQVKMESKCSKSEILQHLLDY